MYSRLRAMLIAVALLGGLPVSAITPASADEVEVAQCALDYVRRFPMAANEWQVNWNGTCGGTLPASMGGTVYLFLREADAVGVPHCASSHGSAIVQSGAWGGNASPTVSAVRRFGEYAVTGTTAFPNGNRYTISFSFSFPDSPTDCLAGTLVEPRDGVGTFTVTHIEATDGPLVYPSDDCTSGSLEEGFVGDVYVRTRVQQVDSRTTWVCLRADGGRETSLGLGGKVVVVQPSGATLPAAPSTDAASGTCSATAGNIVPGPHPLLAGEVGQAGDAYHTPYNLDTHATSSSAWVCLTVRTFQMRAIVPIGGGGAGDPSVTFSQDPIGPRYLGPAPSPAPAQPSAACQDATTGVRHQHANTSVASTKLWLYSWQPSATEAKLCVRVEGVVRAGGVLSVSVPTGTGQLPSVTTGTDVGPCTVQVFRTDSPVQVRLLRSPDGATPASACIVSGTTALRVTVNTTASPPSAASWTPDSA